MAFSKKGKKEAAKAAESVVSAELDITSVLYAEDPLEALLDEEVDEDFGYLELKTRAGQPVKLAEWSARDFSSIYVRFRPYLERHARRFLRNPSQVDEVVQDAFLYLMVSLPELDSEIGVLRFLKWKTRLLALDVIRASGRAYINSIDDVPEPEALGPEVSAALEQQDDAAVVKLALSKLNPRHREVLIASMYEEKSTEQIASQVGLSENATRQLIFRARAAFKKALIGDVDTTGMSAGAILSVAARKAAAEGKKIGASAMALVALVALSLSFWPSINSSSPEDNLAGGVISPTQEPNPSASTGNPSANDDGAKEPEASGSQESGASQPGSTAAPSAKPAPAKSPDANKALDQDNIGALFDSTQKTRLFVLDQAYFATSDKGISAEFTFNPTKDVPFTDVLASIEISGELYSVYPNNSEVFSGVGDDGLTRYVYFGSMNYLFDEEGNIWSESGLAQGTIRIEVIMEANGSVVKEVLLTVLS
jgi:RNA polymerase sigma-70 factor (ECF subfamily)